MPQPDSPNTTIPSRISFASAGAARRPASPQPRRPLTAREIANDIRGARAHLIERITAVPPNVINPFLQADEDDLTLRSEHLRIILRATADYVSALMPDTAYFNSYRRNPRARKIFVNDLGGIYRLDGGVVQVTFINTFEDPIRDPVEQGSLIWPEHNWHEYADKLQWVTQEIVRGTFREDAAQAALNSRPCAVIAVAAQGAIAFESSISFQPFAGEWRCFFVFDLL